MGNVCTSYEAQGAPHQYTTTTATASSSNGNRCQPRDGERDDNNSGGDGNNCAAITSEQKFASSQLALLLPHTSVAPPPPPLVSSSHPDPRQDIKVNCSLLANAPNIDTSRPAVEERPAHLADTSSSPLGGGSHRAAACANGGTSSGDHHEDDDADEALVHWETVLDEDMAKEQRISSPKISAQPPRDQSDDTADVFPPHHTQRESTSLSHPTRVPRRPCSVVHTKIFSGNVSMNSGRGGPGASSLSTTANTAQLLIRSAGESVGGSVANNASLLTTPRHAVGSSLAGGTASTMALFCPSSLDHRDSELEVASP